MSPSRIDPKSVKNSLERRKLWLSQVYQSSFSNILKFGALPLINPSLHQFRDYSPTGNITLKHYQAEKERIKETISKNSSFIVHNTPYKNPSEYRHSLRQRIRYMEIPKYRSYCYAEISVVF